MKRQLKISALLTLILCGCFDRPDPEVNTLHLNGENYEALRMQAVPVLFEYYTKSKSGKAVFEVVSKNGRFILNYVPALDLLSVCGDPGSGWDSQYKNVDDSLFNLLVQDGVTFESLRSTLDLDTKYDTILTKNVHLYPVRTNGSPTL